MGKYIGDKKPGQTRVLRNVLFPDDAVPSTTFKGCSTLAQIYEYGSYLIKKVNNF